MNTLRKLSEVNQWKLLTIYTPLVLLIGFLAGVDSPTVNISPARQLGIVLYISKTLPSESLGYAVVVMALYGVISLLMSFILSKGGLPALLSAFISFFSFRMMENIGRSSLLNSRLIHASDVHVDIFRQIAETVVLAIPSIVVAFFVYRSRRKAAGIRPAPHAGAI